MKTCKRFILFLFIPVVMTGILISSCSKNDMVNGGDPVINYVRVTDPTKSDSLLNTSLLGNLVAIIGDNLGGTKEIWFNDQQAVLNPTYITGKSILVTVPNNAPVSITNKLKLVFGNDKVLLYDFNVSIPAPVVTSMEKEYVADGDTAVINGDFFFAQVPIIVTFTGSTDAATIVSVSKTQLQVIVPTGVTPGPVTIKTNFGETASVFHFRDDRNLLWTADPYQGWWGGNGSGAVVTAPGGYPPAINGNFERETAKALDGSNWTEYLGGPVDQIGALNKAIPDDAILDPGSYSLKFEINTIKPYTAPIMSIKFGNVGNETAGADWTLSYPLPAPIDTKGKWQTITIPFSQVIAPMTDLKVRPEGYGIKFWFWSPDGAIATPAIDVDMSMDNIRVVPNK